MTTSHESREFLALALLAVMTMIVPLMAQNVSDGELLLREALHKQQVEGDLPGAIKIYQQLASAPNRNRSVVARALLEMAGCYEKLGQQAESVYQQIVREFGDQPAAAQARARLAALRPATPSSAMTLRKIEVADVVRNIVGSDGQRVVYWESERRTTLYIGDLTGTQRRVLLETKQAPRAYASRDLSMVFFFFGPSPAAPEKLAMMRTDRGDLRELNLTENGKPYRTSALGPSCGSWSPDNRYLLICSPEAGGTRLLKITAADGLVQDLLPGRATMNSAINRAEFSPDGRFIAYGSEMLMTGAPVMIVPAAGGESELVASGAMLSDWTHDGRHLIVSEPGSKSQTLAAVPIRDGKAIGERISLRTVPGGRARSMSNGALLVYEVSQATRPTWLGSMDANSASVAWKPIELVGSPVGSAFTTWSPDSRSFSYVSGEPGRTARVVRVKDVVSGDDRELYRADQLFGCLWAQHRPVLFCGRPAAAGTQTEILSVSLESRQAETVGMLHAMAILDHLSPDDRKLIAYRGQTNDWTEWEIGTDRQVTLPLYRSEDGRWLLGLAPQPEKGASLRIRPSNGTVADWRPLVARRVPPPTGIGAVPFRFTRDGDWVVYHDRDPEGRDSLYRLATAGGVPERLGDYPTSALSSMLSISPDNRTFIVAGPAIPPRPELWALENFLPAATSKARTGGQNGAK